jgi:putative aldouronate transport system substrate-binding protein
MLKLNKRHLNVFLFILLAATLLNCSKKPAENQAGSSKPEDVHTVVVVAPTMGPVPRGLPEVEGEINKIIEPLINTRVKIQYMTSGTYREQVSLMLASQERIDLLSTHTSGAMHFNVLMAQNQLMDITDLLDKHGQDAIQAIDDILPGALEATKIKGRLFGVTGFYNKAYDPYFIYRNDIVEKHGIDMSRITSLAELEKLLVRIKSLEPGLAPLVTQGAPTVSSVITLSTGSFPEEFDNPAKTVRFDMLGDLSLHLGVVFIDGTDSSKVVNLYKSDFYRSFCDWSRKWYSAGIVYRDVLTNKEQGEEIIKSNRAFSMVVGSEIGVEGSKSAQTGYPIKAIKMSQGVISTADLRKFVWAVPSWSKEADATIKYLNLLCTDERITNLVAWGIEGRDYIVNPDGTVGYPPDLTAQTVPYHNVDFLCGNQFITRVWEGNPPDLRKIAIEENKSAVKSPLMGFSFDPTPVQNEYAAMSNVVAQYKPGLELGVVDPAKELPVFLKALDDAGAEKIIAEMQRQLDDWQKTK